MTNPFEDENAFYLVLWNDEQQHSLWPAAMSIPAGWSLRFGPESRTACVAFIEENWTDMRPASLVREMERDRN